MLFSPKFLKGESFLASFNSWGLLIFLDFYQHNSSLCLHLHVFPFPCVSLCFSVCPPITVCVILSAPSSVCSPVIGFRAHDHSVWLHFTTSAKTVFSVRSHSDIVNELEFWGHTIGPLHNISNVVPSSLFPLIFLITLDFKSKSGFFNLCVISTFDAYSYLSVFLGFYFLLFIYNNYSRLPNFLFPFLALWFIFLIWQKKLCGFFFE